MSSEPAGLISGSVFLLSENNLFLGGQLKRSVDPRKGAQDGLRFDSHVRTVFRAQFLHNIADVNFDGAFTHVQLIGDYLIRLAFLDRPNDGKFEEELFPTMNEIY